MSEKTVCEACDAGYRLAADGLHYDDNRRGQTWGVCRKVVAANAEIRRMAEQISVQYGPSLGWTPLANAIEAALTTVREEARAAAFKEMVGKVATLPTQGTMNYRRGYEEGVRDALRTIEAAANTEEGARDG